MLTNVNFMLKLQYNIVKFMIYPIHKPDKHQKIILKKQDVLNVMKDTFQKKFPETQEEVGVNQLIYYAIFQPVEDIK